MGNSLDPCHRSHAPSQEHGGPARGSSALMLQAVTRVCTSTDLVIGMSRTVARPPTRCVIYTRKSSEEGLEQEFNSLDAQREACEAYIASQRQEGWTALVDGYDDGGFSGGTLERPALQRMLSAIRTDCIDVVVVYKIDRLTRSLFDFAKIVDIFDAHNVSFVSVTQAFNTTTSMGRLTLNVLLSFAQFEREVTGERIRDKIAASKKKGMWMGGTIPLGFDVQDRKLVINQCEAETVRTLFEQYLKHGSVRNLKVEADRLGLRTKLRTTREGTATGGLQFRVGHLYTILKNPIYVGLFSRKGETYPGDREPIIDADLWEAAQRQLELNTRKRRSGASSPEPSLLKGLLFDAAGNRMTPSHAVKNAKRYRYYLSNTLVTGHSDGIRIASSEIEAHVLNELGALLRDEMRLLDELIIELQGPKLIGGIIAKAKALADQITGGTNADRQMAIQTLVQRIVLADKTVTIHIEVDALQLWLGMEASLHRKERLELKSCIQILRLSKETKIVVGGQEKQAGHDPALIKAIVRAHGWFELLKAQKVQSIAEIASREGLKRAYVSSLIPLAFLAPDITEAILQDGQPVELTLDRILRQKPLPINWNAQRSSLGIRPR